jgi:hypothetical protein
MYPTANPALSTWRTLAVGALFALATMPVSAAAAEQMAVKTRLLKNVPLGSNASVGPASFVGPVAYSNYFSSGVTYENGGATNMAGNTVTRLLADDITPLASLIGGDVRELRFTAVNIGVTPVFARINFRFWFDNGGGLPGNYYDVPADVAFADDYNVAIGVNFLSISIPAGTFKLPAGPMWCGISYDDHDGTLGSTAAQLDKLGQAVSGAAAIGTTNDGGFLTTGAGEFSGVDSPAGAALNPVGGPHFNLALELVVDQATPSAKSTWSRVKQLFR